MQVAFHLGFHCTDDDRLARCLLRNAPTLTGLGVEVPAPQSYRPALRQAMAALRETGAVPDAANEALQQALEPHRDRSRVILSHSNLVCFPGRAITEQGLYAAAPGRIADLRAVLGGAPCEVQFALRNPATLIPALIEAVTDGDYATIMNGADPAGLSWFDTVARIRAELPDLPMLVWLSEDLPLIWPELLRRAAGVPPHTRLEGDAEMLGALLTPVGMATLADYLKGRGPVTVPDRRRLTTALLERYAQPGQLEVTLDLPGWTATLVDAMTDRYYRDVERIAAIDGVDLLAP